MKIIKILTLVLTVSAATVALSACSNTWHGAGKDVENVGEGMQ